MEPRVNINDLIVVEQLPIIVQQRQTPKGKCKTPFRLPAPKRRCRL